MRIDPTRQATSVRREHLDTSEISRSDTLPSASHHASCCLSRKHAPCPGRPTPQPRTQRNAGFANRLFPSRRTLQKALFRFEICVKLWRRSRVRRLALTREAHRSLENVRSLYSIYRFWAVFCSVASMCLTSPIYSCLCKHFVEYQHFVRHAF